MKVLLVSELQKTTPPLGYGGTERFCYYLAKELLKEIEVRLLVKTGSKSDIDENYYYFDETKHNLTELLIDTINKFKPNIVHLNTKSKEVFYSLQKMGIPVVVTIHNNVRKNSSWHEIISQQNDKFYFCVLSNSQKNKIILDLKEKMISIPKNGLTNLGFGMDVEYYKKYLLPIFPKEYYIYIGTVARYKAVLDIVKAFTEIGKRLIIVGPHGDFDNSYVNEIDRLIKKSKADIVLYGETKSELEKINLIKKAKSLVIATGYDPLESDCNEAFGLVMLEANALGVPIIGYSKGNMRDFIINGVNGYQFTDIKEIKNIAERTEKLDLFSTCITESEKYDIKNVAKNYRKLYDSILLT